MTGIDGAHGLDRRAFLGSATLVLAAAAGGALADAAGAATPRRTAPLSRATFTPLLGRTLLASGRATRARLKVMAVADVLGSPAGSQGSFLLQFASPTAIPDGIYTLTHPALGEQSLFLSAVYGGAARRYEAVVNQVG